MPKLKINQRLRLYKHNYFIKHRERYRIADNVRYAMKKEFINRFKMRPCADCSIQYNPWVMQFDHRNPENKEIGIGTCKGYSLERIKKEIEKCDVVCANCHMERTHKQIEAGVLRSRRSIKEI